jgi:NAD(P)-dependent dehydrogenase (short-subunit alcohol dehydrogenase family)
VPLAVDTFGRLDVPANNAGYGSIAPFEQMRAEDFRAVVDTCFYGVVYTTRAAVPVMREEERSHLSSVFGRWSPRGCRRYAVSRGHTIGGRSVHLHKTLKQWNVAISRPRSQLPLLAPGLRINHGTTEGTVGPVGMEIIPDERLISGTGFCDTPRTEFVARR